MNVSKLSRRLLFSSFVILFIFAFTIAEAGELYGVVVGNVSKSTISKIQKIIPKIKYCNKFGDCHTCSNFLGNNTNFIILVYGNRPIAVIYSGANISNINIISLMQLTITKTSKPLMISVFKKNEISHVPIIRYQDFILCLHHIVACPLKEKNFQLKIYSFLGVGVAVMFIVAYIFNRKNE